jgi:hypothetical protein
LNFSDNEDDDDDDEDGEDEDEDETEFMEHENAYSSDGVEADHDSVLDRDDEDEEEEDEYDDMFGYHLAALDHGFHLDMPQGLFYGDMVESEEESEEESMTWDIPTSSEEEESDDYDEDDPFIDSRPEHEILEEGEGEGEGEGEDDNDTEMTVPYHTREGNYYDQLHDEIERLGSDEDGDDEDDEGSSEESDGTVRQQHMPSSSGVRRGRHIRVESDSD